MYFQGALRNAIRVFIPVSPTIKDTIWRYLEQYDLPVVVGTSSGTSAQQMSTQVNTLVMREGFIVNEN